VIGSDIGGIPEFVQPGRTGLLFPPGDAQALADILASIAGADMLPDLAQASARMAEGFTVSRMIDGYEEHYRELVRTALSAASFCSDGGGPAMVADANCAS